MCDQFLIFFEQLERQFHNINNDVLQWFVAFSGFFIRALYLKAHEIIKKPASRQRVKDGKILLIKMNMVVQYLWTF